MNDSFGQQYLLMFKPVKRGRIIHILAIAGSEYADHNTRHTAHFFRIDGKSICHSQDLNVVPAGSIAKGIAVAFHGYLEDDIILVPLHLGQHLPVGVGSEIGEVRGYFKVCGKLHQLELFHAIYQGNLQMELVIYGLPHYKTGRFTPGKYTRFSAKAPCFQKSAALSSHTCWIK